MTKDQTDFFLKRGVFTELDLRFGRFMTKLSGGESEELFLAAALVSHLQGEGHICLDLSSFSGKALVEDSADAPVPAGCPELPKLNAWRKAVKASAVVGRPGDYRPLVLEGSRLYLYRYWDYEKRLAEILKERMHRDRPKVDRVLLKDGLKRLFPNGKRGETDWQKVAAFASVTKGFVVVSGGPGTGKTTTAARILALLKEQAGEGTFRVALAAPTGKAAARLQETIKAAREEMDCRDGVKAALPGEASTIHRLLGTVPGSPYFRHDSKNPLALDVVVIDESSMVDLALLSKLVQAIPPEARLILLGDKDQLASVEAGAVLGDICDTGRSHVFSSPFRKLFREVAGESLEEEGPGEGKPGPADSIIPLRKNYRFDEKSGIGRVSRCVNEGNGESSLRLLKDEACPDCRWQELPGPDHLARAMRDRVLDGFAAYLGTDDPGEAFRLLNAFRILCALREGPYGVHAVNRLAEQVLAEKGLVRPESRWYRGRPVLVTRNDYNLRLYNGDVGILLPDPTARNELRAFFQAPDGSFKRILPLRLPEHETVYAMTAHKSQGSEFDRILIILPDRMAPVLTRELVYTALTRARKEVEVWGKEGVFREAIARRIERTSGLREALWGR